MSPQEVEATYISFSQIAKECGVSATTPHNWSNYHNFFKKFYILEKPAALRSEYEEFKRTHPELVNSASVAVSEAA